MALVDFYPSMQPSAAEVQNGKFFTLPIRPTKITQILSVLTHFISVGRKMVNDQAQLFADHAMRRGAQVDYPAFFARNETGGAPLAHNDAMISVVAKLMERNCARSLH